MAVTIPQNTLSGTGLGENPHGAVFKDAGQDLTVQGRAALAARRGRPDDHNRPLAHRPRSRGISKLLAA